MNSNRQPISLGDIATLKTKITRALTATPALIESIDIITNNEPTITLLKETQELLEKATKINITLETARTSLEDIMNALQLDKTTAKGYRSNFTKYLDSKNFEKLKIALLLRVPTLEQIHQECEELLNKPPPIRTVTNRTNSTQPSSRPSCSEPRKTKNTKKTREPKTMTEYTISSDNDTSESDYATPPPSKHRQRRTTRKPQSPPRPYPADQTNFTKHQSSTTTYANKTIKHKKRVNLPKIELVKFKGDPVEYPKFKACFNNDIDYDDTVDVKSKFSYLQSVLQGQALKVIEGFTHSEEGYKEAWKALDATYNDPVELGKILNARLNNIPRATGNIESLTDTLLDIKKVLVLQAANKQVADTPLFHELIISKFPANIQKEIDILEARNQKQWTIKSLLESIAIIIRQEKIAQLRETLENQPSTTYSERAHIPAFTTNTQPATVPPHCQDTSLEPQF